MAGPPHPDRVFESFHKADAGERRAFVSITPATLSNRNASHEGYTLHLKFDEASLFE
jgi:hypothetical protein